MPRRVRCRDCSAACMAYECDLLLVQTSFKDVRCINAGAIPFPKHGRQIETEVSEAQDEEVWQSHAPLRHPKICVR